MFLLNPNQHPGIADLINNLNSWNKRADAESIGAGTFLMVYTHVNTSLRKFLMFEKMSSQQCIDVLTAVREQMMKDFGASCEFTGNIIKISNQRYKSVDFFAPIS